MPTSKSPLMKALKVIIYLLFAGMAIVAFVLSIIGYVRSPSNGTNGVDGTDCDGLVLSMFAYTVATVGNTTQTISFANETLDTGSFHNDTYPTRFTVSVGNAGIYSIQVVLIFTSVIPSDRVLCRLVKNNSTVLTYGATKFIDNQAGATVIPNVNLFYLDDAVVGDYYTVTTSTVSSLNTIASVNLIAIYQGQP